MTGHQGPSSGHWPPAAIEQLRALHRDGRSYGQIAKELSEAFQRPFTRSSICGQAHRLGLKREKPAAPPRPWRQGVPLKGAARLAKAVEDSQRAAPEQIGWDHKQNGPMEARIRSKLRAGEKEVAPFRPLPGSTPILWTQRRFGECAWPIGAPAAPGEQLSCCLPTVPGKSYCKQHQAMMHRTALSRGDQLKRLRTTRPERWARRA